MDKLELPEEKTSESKEFTKGLLEQKINIYYAISRMKSEIGKLSKSAENPFFKSKYLDLPALLNAIDPLFDKWGLLLLQPVKDGRVYTKIILVETGESIESYMELIDTIKDPQKIGSQITYFRRYTLESLLGLRAEDDDGNGAAKPPAAPPAKPAKKELKPISKARFKECVEGIKSGKSTGKTTVAALKKAYIMTSDQEEFLIKTKARDKVN